MSLRIGLLGNSAIAFPALEALLEAGQLAGLGVPAIPHDANHRMQQLARERGLPLIVAQEATAADELRRWVSEARLDAVFVVTFPYRVPRPVLDAPRLGIFNFHASPLPRYRGPDPLFWQLRHGARESALCAHRMTAGLDDGPVALRVPLVLTPEDTYGVAHFRAGFAAREAASQLAALLEKHGAALPLAEQDERAATRFPRPGPDDLVVDWAGQTPDDVCALVRACNPAYGGAVTFFRGVPVRLYEASPLAGGEKAPPGRVLAVAPELRVACREGAVRLEVLFTDDGVFSGPRFARLFGVAPGETLGAPPTG